jgi:hypothetical protein
MGLLGEMRVGCQYGYDAAQCTIWRAPTHEQAAARDTGGQCQQALTRLFGYYLAAAALDVLFPA